MLKELMVLGVPYEVRWVDGDDSDLDGFYGKADHTRRIIKIGRESGNGRCHARTLLHEIIHCVNAAMVSDDKLYFKEQQVTLLASGLFSVLMENPELLTELQHVATVSTGATSQQYGGTRDGDSGRPVSGS